MILRLFSKALVVRFEMALIKRNFELSAFYELVGHVPCVFSTWLIKWGFLASLFVVSRDASQKSLSFLGLRLVSIVPKSSFLRLPILEIGTEAILLPVCNSHVSLTKTTISRDESGNRMHFALTGLHILMCFPSSFRLIKADRHIEDS